MNINYGGIPNGKIVVNNGDINEFAEQLPFIPTKAEIMIDKERTIILKWRFKIPINHQIVFDKGGNACRIEKRKTQ